MKRLVAFTICMLVLSISLTACSNEPSIYIDKDDSPLMIYIPDNNEFIKYHIDRYNDAHEATQIEYKVIDQNYYLEWYKKMDEIEIRKDGAGPDLIFIDSTLMQNRNIIKMAQDGLFEDLDKSIARSQSFNPDNYDMDVLDTGIINEKRVFIPITHRLDIAVASTKNFNDFGLEIPEELNLDMLLQITDVCNEEAEYSLALFGIDLERTLFNYLDESNQLENTYEINKLIKEAQKNSKYKIHNKLKIYNLEWYELFFLNRSLFTQIRGGENIFSSLYYQYNLFHNKYDSDMALFNTPLTIDNPKSYPNQGLAINVNSEKKNSAFQFIEYMLSEEVQSDNLYSPSMPVRIESYKLVKEKLLNNDYDMFINADFTPTPVPFDLVNQFIDMVENAECEFNNFDYIKKYCFHFPFMDYRNGKFELEHIIYHINSNLDFYYNEEEE